MGITGITLFNEYHAKQLSNRRLPLGTWNSKVSLENHTLESFDNSKDGFLMRIGENAHLASVAQQCFTPVFDGYYLGSKAIFFVSNPKVSEAIFWLRPLAAPGITGEACPNLPIQYPQHLPTCLFFRRGIDITGLDHDE
nr:MAG: hypothetical protein BECKTC1821F_GA0114240_105814 [Candidatus Kentron sp. TC]